MQATFVLTKLVDNAPNGLHHAVVVLSVLPYGWSVRIDHAARNVARMRNKTRRMLCIVLVQQPGPGRTLVTTFILNTERYNDNYEAGSENFAQ